MLPPARAGKIPSQAGGSRTVWITVRLVAQLTVRPDEPYVSPYYTGDNIHEQGIISMPPPPEVLPLKLKETVK